jgi:hypothetical protein
MRSYILLTIIILLVGMIAVPTGVAAPPAQQPQNTPTPKWDTPTPPPTSTPEPPSPTSTLEPTAAPTRKPRSKPRTQPSPTPVLVLLPESGKQSPPLWLVFPALLAPAIGLLLRTIGKLADR